MMKVNLELKRVPLLRSLGVEGAIKFEEINCTHTGVVLASIVRSLRSCTMVDNSSGA